MVDGDRPSRRAVLGGSTAGILGLAGIGTVGAVGSGDDADEGASPDDVATVGGTDDRPDDERRTKRDYEATLDALGIGSGVRESMTSPGDPTREHLEYFDHREETGTLETVMKIADVEWMLTAWEAVDEDGDPLTDSSGNYYYVLEYLAVSDEVSAWWRNDGKTTSLVVEADLSSSASMEGRDPRTTHSVNGDWVTVSAGVTVGGYGVSAETEQWVDHGDFGPENWTPGPAGTYGVMFDGETPGGGHIDIIGFASVAQSYQATNIWSLIDEWSWGAAGHHLPV